MKKMIKSLTKEQQAKFQHYVDKWLAIGLSTEPANPEKAKAAIRKAYECAGIPAPDQIFGPFDCPLCSIRAEKDFFGTKETNLLSAQIFGSMDAYWLAFYDFFREECQLDGLEQLDGLFEVSKQCGWWTPYKDVAFFQHRPSHVSFNAQKRLHCETGPAIAYRCGHIKLYFLNGVKMDEKHVMTPAEKINPKDVLGEKNVEVRRELIRKVGIERLLSEMKCKILDKKGNYELLDVYLSEEVPHARYLKMTNPSIGTFHVEGVEGNTVQEALNFRAKSIQLNEDWSPSVLT